MCIECLEERLGGPLVSTSPSFPPKAGLLFVYSIASGSSRRNRSDALRLHVSDHLWSSVAHHTGEARGATRRDTFGKERARVRVPRAPGSRQGECLFYARTRPRVFDIALAYSSEGVRACFIIVVMPSRLTVRVLLLGVLRALSRFMLRGPSMPQVVARVPCRGRNGVDSNSGSRRRRAQGKPGAAGQALRAELGCPDP